jgi:uncharacterized protein (TIGR02265 family)
VDSEAEEGSVTGITVKAFILARLLDLAKEKLSPDELAKLEADLGVQHRLLKVAFFSDHPVELQIRLEERLAPVVWGRSDDQAFYLFGRQNFETFAASAVGRTMLALTGKDPKRIVMTSLGILSRVMNGAQIEVVDRGPRDVSFRFRNNPYRPLGWQGVIDATLEHAGVKPKVQLIQHGGGDTEYLISWE